MIILMSLRVVGPFGPEGCEIIDVQAKDWNTELEQSLMKIEEVFPEEVRDSPEYLKQLCEMSDSIFLIAKIRDFIVGYVAGAPLENFGTIPGVKQDPHFGIKDTIYIESIAVIREFQGKGVGKQLRRAFLLRASSKKFRFVTGHVKKGYAKRWSASTLQRFPNHYNTSETYEYFRRGLDFGSWIDGSRSLMTAAAVLGGFSATFLSSVLLITFTNIIFLTAPAIISGILCITGATGSFIYSVERTSDAIDHQDPNIYTEALIPFNIGVILFFFGLSFELIAYGAIHWLQGQTSLTFFIIFVLAAIILTATTVHWFRDLFWLLKEKNRLSYAASLEFGEE
jgi:GNAT superfamily N-acetyltransferase